MLRAGLSRHHSRRRIRRRPAGEPRRPDICSLPPLCPPLIPTLAAQAAGHTPRHSPFPPPACDRRPAPSAANRQHRSCQPSAAPFQQAPYPPGPSPRRADMPPPESRRRPGPPGGPAPAPPRMTPGGIPPDSTPPGDCQAETSLTDWPGIERTPLGVLCKAPTGPCHASPRRRAGRSPGTKYRACHRRHASRRGHCPGVIHTGQAIAWPDTTRPIGWPERRRRRTVPTVVGTRYRASYCWHHTVLAIASTTTAGCNSSRRRPVETVWDLCISHGRRRRMGDFVVFMETWHGQPRE